MTPELEDFARQLDAVKADSRALVAGLSRAQFNWRPAPDRWSVAECLVHLNVCVTKTLPSFDRAIESGRERGLVAQGPFRYGWFASWMARSMEPPPKRRFKTARIFAMPPAASHSPDLVLSEFLTIRDQLAERVRRADGLDLKRVKAISPVTTLLRLPLGAYFAFVIGHERRHLWQAHRVREQHEFPQH